MDEPEPALVVLSAAGRVRADLAAGDPREAAARIVGESRVEPVARALAGPWVDGGGRVLGPDHPEWPAGLSVLGPYEPLLLWMRGTLAPSLQRCVSVVGSRACTDYGRRASGRIAEVLTGAGLTVVSGGARGIDAAAHSAALGRGATAVVAAGGAGLVYPAEHARLFDRAGREGAVVWEYPPGARLTRSGFLHRNRLIAAVSCATVVVEAAYRSGALNTGRTAADLGRLVLGVPGPLGSPASAGVHRGVADGWAALLIDYDDLLELLPVGAS